VQPKWIDAVISGSHKLQILIDDLFSMSQMGMGIFTYTFAQHSVLELLNKVITDNRLLHKRIISFENESAHSLFQIDCDPNKLELVFNNIIGNSIKYSESSTPIHVSLKRKTNVIIISFVDQGRGIPKEDLPHIFEQFYQGKHRANGMGLGMYLCKEIVEAHHGEIRISSTLGKGTKVSMYFPVT
jgi:signal transduction histidine kinase